MLEQAVAAIEETILRASPNVKEKTYRIESRKTIDVGGVHHEIDVFVTFELGPGYTSVYIFECKNWKEAVGKNEIIVFAEKIAAAGAQRGFFVAKSFTSDAAAQAAKEPRMELIVAAEHDPATTILPFSYQSTSAKALHVNAHFTRWGASGTNTVKRDYSTAVATLDGHSLNLSEYVTNWADEAMKESMLTFPSATLPEGRYQRECTAERKFAEGKFIINDAVIQTARITVQFEIDLVRPAVKSHFVVGGRGRVISFEAHTVGPATIAELQFIFGPEPNNQAPSQ